MCVCVCVCIIFDGAARESIFEKVTSEQRPGGGETRRNDMNTQKEAAQAIRERACSRQGAKAGAGDGESCKIWNQTARGHTVAPHLPVL